MDNKTCEILKAVVFIWFLPLYLCYKAISAFWGNLPARPNPVAAEETIALPPTAHNPVASTNPTQSHPVAAEGGEKTTTTRPLTAPNPVATGGGEERSLPMADDEVRVLWCFIKGDSTAFEVTAPVRASIGRLKKLVWEERKHGVLRETDATDLVLWKVSSECPADSTQLTSCSSRNRRRYIHHRLLLGALRHYIYRCVRSSCRILAIQCWTSSWKSPQLGAFTLL